MEDYERTNALQWDVFARDRVHNDSQFNQQQEATEQWTVVTSKGKKSKAKPSPRKAQTHRPKPGPAHERLDPVVCATGSTSASSRSSAAGTVVASQDQSDSTCQHRTSPAPIITWTRADVDAMSSRNKAAPRRAAVKKQTRRPQPNLALVNDSVAETSWRNHAEPAAHLLIPSVVLSYGTHGREDELDRIARHNNAFIACLDGGRDNNLTFGIWGKEAAVRNTMHTLNEWIHKSEESSKSKGSFAKITNMTAHNKDKAMKALRKNIRQQRYRRNPPLDAKFETQGSFDWPVDEFRPEDTLGMNLEALDPIRLELSCYMTFIKEQGVFNVCGKHEKVLEAFKRLGGTYWQLVARQIEPERLFRPYWSKTLYLPTHVRLAPYEQPKDIFKEHINVQSPQMPLAEGTDLLSTDTAEQNMDNLLELQNTILSTLRQLHYYRGCIQMRIRLGTFVATQYKRLKEGEDTYELSFYEMMIQEDVFEGHVTQELGNKMKEALALEALQNAKSLLLPADNLYEHLADVQPEYSVTFTFEESTGDICLTLTWSRIANTTTDASTDFDKGPKVWTRLERDANTPAPILSANMSDLHNGMAWAFEITATQPIEESRLSEAYHLFSESVRFDTSAAISHSTEKLFVDFRPPTGNIQLKHIQQRSTYRYTVLSVDKSNVATDYVLELTRFQDCEVQPGQPRGRIAQVPRSAPRQKGLTTKSAAPQNPEKKAFYEPRWGLQIYRDGWDVEFARNAKMKIGEKAEWCHWGRVWFPVDGGSEEAVGKTAEETGGEEQESEGGETESKDGLLEDAGEVNEKRIDEMEIEKEEEEVGKGFLQLFEKLERVKETVCG